MPKAAAPRTRDPDGVYRTAAVMVAIIAAGGLLLMLLHFQVVWLMLLAFAGILIAVLLRAMADGVKWLTRLGHGWSLAIVLAGLIGFFTLLFWLMAPPLLEQAGQLADQLPKAFEHLRHQLEQNRFTRQLVRQMPATGQLLAQPPHILERATGIVWNAIDAIIHFVIVLFIAIFIAAEPRLYVEGVVRLVPFRGRRRAREILQTVGFSLRWWLIGQGITMVVIGLVTWLGLLIIGIPMALGLGLLAALFNFVPNFGPLVSMIPASLLALAIGPDKFLWVVGLYLVAQNLEGYVLGPLVQRKAVLMPPALTIFMQVLMAWLVGPLGLILAAPLTAAALIIVKMAYVEDVLDDENVEVPGEAESRRKVAKESRKEEEEENH